MNGQPQSLVGRIVRGSFAVAGLGFLVVAFARTWDGSPEAVTPGWWPLVLSLALIQAGLLCAFRAWAQLIGGRYLTDGTDRRALAAGFYLSQLGKYLPGGIWQAAGQIGYTVHARVPLRQATSALMAFVVVQTVATASLGATIGIVGTALPPSLRLAALATASLALFLDRRWMLWAMRLASRVTRGTNHERLVPPQGAILRAFAWNVGTILATGVGFAVLLSGLTGELAFSAVPAFALAWTIGFLAFPVPAGLGVREGALIVLLAAVGDPHQVIAASLGIRVLTMLAEALAIAGSRFGLARPTLRTRWTVD